MSSTQRAAYLAGPHNLQLKEVKIPRVSGELVLVKLKATGICGSDIECYLGHSKEGRYDIAPYVPGHEWAGEVVDVGEDVSALKRGDKVTGECILPCGKCYSCKSGLPPSACENMGKVGFMPNNPGGMEQYLALEERFLHKLPEEMTYEEGALVEPFSVSYFAIWGEGGYVDASDDVVIFGAGPIGLLALVVAKTAGAKGIVVEPIQSKREWAKKLGADEVIDSKTADIKESVFDLTSGRGSTLVVEASGNDEAIAQCFDVVAGSGRIRLIGHSVGRKVPVEIGLTNWKGLFIHGQAGAPWFFPRTIKFMQRAKQRIDYSRIITHRFSLDDIQKAFDLATRHKGQFVKIMLIID